MTAAPPPASRVLEAVLRDRLAPCTVVGLHPRPAPLPLARWCGAADVGDRRLLDHCVGRTIDLGCGPGRMAEELARRGHDVVGVDRCRHAVRLSRERGVDAVLADLFGPLPGEGGWETALLADGNIGIGGDPVRLLTRTATLLAPGGRVVLDVAAPGTGVRVLQVRLVVGPVTSAPFPWAVVGADALDPFAAAAGLDVHRVADRRGRWFAVLRRPGGTPCPD